MHAIDFHNCAKGMATGFNNGDALLSLTSPPSAKSASITSPPPPPGRQTPSPASPPSSLAATPKSTGAYYDVAYDRSLDAPAQNHRQRRPGRTPALHTPLPPEPPPSTRKASTSTRPSSTEALPEPASPTAASAPSTPPASRAIPRPAAPPSSPGTSSAPIPSSASSTTPADIPPGPINIPSYSSVAGPGGNTLDDYLRPRDQLAPSSPSPASPPPKASRAPPSPTPPRPAPGPIASQISSATTPSRSSAILRQIHGKTHNGADAQVPNLFGMNFQAVSVAQKLIEPNVATGGYLDAEGYAHHRNSSARSSFIDASIGPDGHRAQRHRQLRRTPSSS